MVEERGEAWLELARNNGGGVGEAFGEDWGCGELVIGFVGVMEDYDLGLGFDGPGRERVAEADRAGSGAVAAYGPGPTRWWIGGGAVGDVDVSFWFHHSMSMSNYGPMRSSLAL